MIDFFVSTIGIASFSHPLETNSAEEKAGMKRSSWVLIESTVTLSFGPAILFFISSEKFIHIFGSSKKI
jgi:hypothetical protein